MAVSSSAKSKTIAYEGVNELLEELVARIPEELRDDDITTARLRERLRKDGKRVSRSWAQHFLNREAEEGRLIRVEVRVSTGGNGVAYRKP